MFHCAPADEKEQSEKNFTFSMLAMSGYAETLVEQYKFRIFCLLVQMVTRCKSWWIPNNTVFAIWEFCDVNGYTSQTL